MSFPRPSALLLILLFLVVGCAPIKEQPTDRDAADPDAGASELEITETYWKLIQLNGQAVVTGERQAREVYMLLREAENRLTGFAGCNNMRGFYDLGEDNRIRFRQVATTRMVCPGVEVDEAAVVNMLNLSDTYIIGGNTLTLHLGRGGPLAVFHAISR